MKAMTSNKRMQSDISMSLHKIIVIWILVATAALISGYLMAWHGAVYYEAAEKAGDPGLFYRLESIAGQILMWPVFGVGWLLELVNPITFGHRTINVLPMLGLHYAGYGLIFLFYFRFGKKKHLAKNK